MIQTIFLVIYDFTYTADAHNPCIPVQPGKDNRKGVGSLFTMPSAYHADAASTLGSTVWRHGPPSPDCQTDVHAAHCNVSPPTHSLSPVGSPTPPTVAAAPPASRLESFQKPCNRRACRITPVDPHAGLKYGRPIHRWKYARESYNKKVPVKPSENLTGARVR